jgi:RNA polymerase sigma-70 factor (ECF subfamily)
MSLAVSTVVTYGDDELIARALSGERELFEHIVHRYHRPVATFIHRMVGDYETSLDLTQEVFLKVYTALDRYDERYKFSTWLFKIASNHAIDHLRKQNGKMLSLDGTDGKLELSPLEVVSAEPSPERQSILNQRRAIIESAIACLPLPYRQVIVLRHMAELSYEEIAEITALPLGTVKNRIFRAREAMREQLLKRGIDGTE